MFIRTRILCAGVSAFFLLSCTDTPRPQITIQPEEIAENGPPRVSADIVPNQFAVTDVILEFGRRPGMQNAVAILYDSSEGSYGLPRTTTPNLPTTQPFRVSFSLSTSGPNRIREGEVIDYQFKVTHLSEGGSPLFFWSERRNFQVGAPIAAPPGGGPVPGGPVGGGGGEEFPNLLPSVLPNYVLTRPLGAVIATPSGGMSRVADFFCSGNLTPGVTATVNVPPLTWGVIGVNIEAAVTSFDVQLLDVSDESNHRLLDTLNLPQGFPANTPLVQKDNYPGRASSIRVVLNPTFQMGTAPVTYQGCFTEPGSNQTLDPAQLMVKVDPGNTIDEGDRENDNELRF